MKKILSITLMLLAVLTVAAKDIKTVVLTTDPIMHCESCENKIREQLRFEKGVKDIKACHKSQAVTITYDADKTNVDKLIASLAKIGYTATVKTTECCEKKPKGCCQMKAEGCCETKKSDCCEKQQ